MSRPWRSPARATTYARRLGLFSLLLLLLAAVIATVTVIRHERAEQRLQATAQRLLADDATFSIPPGTPLGGIADLAVTAGVPATRREFMTLARRFEVDKSLQAGSYRFAAGKTVAEVIHGIATGAVIQEKITFIEGRTFADIRVQLAQDDRLTHKLPDMSDEDIRRALDITEPHLEGLFSPQTYFFHPGDSDLSLLRRAHQQLRQTLAKHWQHRAAHHFFQTPYEALILASIVEKETGKPEERPLIASVFLNRLRAGIRLQADPTVIYGLGERFDGNLRRTHLRENTPYNTYYHAGLTPTPIALAGEAAIAAVLNPVESEYYYFVATGDGGHYFSKNLREHNNAVNRYQRKRRK